MTTKLSLWQKIALLTAGISVRMVSVARADTAPLYQCMTTGRSGIIRGFLAAEMFVPAGNNSMATIKRYKSPQGEANSINSTATSADRSGSSPVNPVPAVRVPVGCKSTITWTPTGLLPKEANSSKNTLTAHCGSSPVRLVIPVRALDGRKSTTTRTS